MTRSNTRLPSTEIEVIQISPNEWRVRDATRLVNDASSLRGFVTEQEHRFEVFKMGDPLARHYFDSLAKAVTFLTPVCDG